MDDNGGRGIGGECCWWSGRQSRDKHGRDGEAGIGVGDRAIGSRRMEHPCGDDKRGRSNHFDMSRRWERRVIGAGEGMKESKEGGGNEKWSGGEAAAVDANHRGWDADIALGDDMVDCEGEGERADEGTHDIDTIAAMAVAVTEGRGKRRHHRSSSSSSEDDDKDEGK